MTKHVNVAPYPQEILDLQTPEGFEQQFHILWGTDAYKSREACFEDLSAHYEHFYGQRRYEDYNAFRNCLSYRKKKNKKANH